MVRRILPDHLSPAHAPVDRSVVACGRTDRRLHARATGGCDPVGGRHLEVRPVVGGRSRRQPCSRPLHIYRDGFISCLLGRTATHHFVSSLVSAGASLLLSVVTIWFVALALEGAGVGPGGRLCAPRHPVVWLRSFRGSGAVACLVRRQD